MMPPALPFDLLDNERLIWSGRPVQGLLLNPRDLLLIPSGVFSAGLAAMFGLGAVDTVREDTADTVGVLAFGAFAAVFFVSGLWIASLRLVWERWKRARTTYALTDGRVIIARTGPFATLTSLPLDQLPDAELTRGWGGRGSIAFGQAARAQDRAAGDADPRVMLGDILDSPRVFDLIQQARRNRR